MAYTSTATIRTIIRGLIKDLLNAEGRNAFTYTSDTSFKIDTDRVSSATITVYVNGTDITSSNWSFNSDTNKVTITSSLTAEDDVIITFSYYEKYSDTELNSYIESNLARFVQFKYPKLFYMDDSDNVLASNGENPTEEEGYIIALVTAIDIDPQNINIQTRDFTISATEKKSKSELIRDVIGRFSKGYISLDFLEVESE